MNQRNVDTGIVAMAWHMGQKYIISSKFLKRRVAAIFFARIKFNC